MKIWKTRGDSSILFNFLKYIQKRRCLKYNAYIGFYVINLSIYNHRFFEGYQNQDHSY